PLFGGRPDDAAHAHALAQHRRPGSTGQARSQVPQAAGRRARGPQPQLSGDRVGTRANEREKVDRGSHPGIPAGHAHGGPAWTAAGPGRRRAAWYGAGHAPAPAGGGTDTAPYPTGYRSDRPAHNATLPPSVAAPDAGPPGAPAPWGSPPPRRRRIPRLVSRTAVVLVVGLIFRRAIAALVLTALSAAFHLVGINVHLPHVKFAWPWQAISAGTTTNIDLGPWVLQKIQGISKPALGRASFNFYFTHKVSKDIGPWPCWYASTFYAVGHAAATVDLNPGPAWWAPSTGHYRLRVISGPAHGKPGHVAVSMVLPRPQLPQSVH